SLSDRRVLAVDGDEASSGGACGIEDDGPADDERLLVRQGHIGAPGQGGQCRSETGGTGDRVEDHVGLETRDRLGGGVTEVDDLDGIADPAGGGECGQSAADLGLSPGRRGRSEERRGGQAGRAAWALAEDGIRDRSVTGVQTCALPISASVVPRPAAPVIALRTMSASSPATASAAVSPRWMTSTGSLTPRAAASAASRRRISASPPAGG